MSSVDLSLHKTDKIFTLLKQAAACSDLAQVSQGLEKAFKTLVRLSTVAGDT